MIHPMHEMKNTSFTLKCQFMEDNMKKPVFEPVSAEEAKKIRATANDDVPPSGLECSSGSAYAACEGKSEGYWCCEDRGNRYYGRCGYDDNDRPSGSTLPRQLKCKEIPGVFPGRKL